jgi:hypothetical protein
MLFSLAIPVFALLHIGAAALNLATAGKAALHLVTFLVLTGLTLAVSDGQGNAILGSGWRFFAMGAGIILAGAGWFVRGHRGAEDNLAARLMGALGGAAILACVLIPQEGRVPLVDMLKYVADAELGIKVFILCSLILVLLAALSILGAFVSGLAAAAKVWAYAITLWAGATVVFAALIGGIQHGEPEEIIGSMLAMSIPAVMYLGAAAFGLAYVVQKITADQPQPSR